MSDTSLSANAKVVFCALAMHRSRQTGQCNPSQSDLSKETGIPRESISRLIADLRRAGYVATSMGGTKKGKRLDYVLLISMNASSDEASPTTSGSCDGTSQVNTTTDGGCDEASQVDPERCDGTSQVDGGGVMPRHNGCDGTSLSPIIWTEQSTNKKIKGHAATADRQAKLQASSHWTYIERVCAKFVAQPNATKLTPAQMLSAQEVVEKTLRIDMDDAPDCEKRLSAIIAFASTNDFWSTVGLRSLGSLRAKGKGGAPKWQNIEQSMLLAERKARATTEAPRRGPVLPHYDPNDRSPPIDTTCDCKHGWIDLPGGARAGCPKCDRGKWIRRKDHMT